MRWLLKDIRKETDHRFLNFFTFTYSVEKDGEESLYPYFLASRHEQESLIARTANFRRPDGVLMAVIQEEPAPSILLIEQFRPPLNARVIEFPAGLLEDSDSNEIEAAKRECVEEAGVVIDDVRLLCPASPTSSGLSDEMVSIVEGRVAHLTQRHLERFEDIQARFVPLTEIPARLDDPNLLIAVNVRLTLLYLLERYRKEV